MIKTLLTIKQAKIFLLLEGLVSVSIQFLVLRQITPFVGSGSVIVTSIVISCFLAALAYGYHRGGLKCDDPKRKLSNNLYYASIYLGVGISYALIEVVFQLIISPIIALCFYLAIFMVPTVFFVAQTVPLLVNYLQTNSNNRASKMAGDALTASTVGNVIGGLITTLLIMYYLGVAWAIIINSLVLLFIAVALDSTRTKRVKAFLIIVISLVVTIINIAPEVNYFVETNSYANYRVIEEDNGRLFVNNASNASYINDKNETHAYIRHIQNLLFNIYGITNKKILVLGAGGFTLTAKSTYGNDVTYVDIDPDIKRIVEGKFLQQPIKGKFIAQDARSYLFNSKNAYDVIFLDVFNSLVDSPTHFTTKEFFKLAHSKINNNGYFIANTVSSSSLADRHSKNIDTTIRSVFNSCYSNVIIYDKSWQKVVPRKLYNVIYSCYVNDLETTKEIYVDGTTRENIHHFIEKK